MDMQLRMIERGDKCFSAKDYDQAITEYSKAVELNPKFALAYSKRAAAYVSKGKHDRNASVEQLKKEMATSQPWRVMGMVEVVMEKVNESFLHAFSDFDTAIRLNPRDAVVFFNRGSLFAESYRNTPLPPLLQNAMADLSRAIELNGGFSQAYYNRGYLYSFVEDDKRALSDFSEAIRIAPHDTQSLSARGLLYASQGRFDKALDDFNRIVLLDPDNPEVYLTRGTIHKDKGERALAVSDFRKVLELSRDDSLRQEAQAKLQELEV